MAKQILAIAVLALACVTLAAETPHLLGDSSPQARQPASKVARIQLPAPTFSAAAVVDGVITQVDLASYKGKYVVLLFYPLDFTFVCPTEIVAFDERLGEFNKIGAQVLAISVDSVYTHLAWVKTARAEGGLGKIRLPLVSDLSHSISRSYGVLLEEAGHSLRGLFIIDDKGILRQSTINDLPVGRSVDETLRLVQAFQFTDKHGEVCPAGWKPGSLTITPNPEDKLTYFKEIEAERATHL